MHGHINLKSLMVFEAYIFVSDPYISQINSVHNVFSLTYTLKLSLQLHPHLQQQDNTIWFFSPQITHAWEDVKAMFNGGTRKRLLASASVVHHSHRPQSTPTPAKQAKVTQETSPATLPFSANPASLPAPPPRVPPFPDLPLPLSRSLVMDYVWHHSTSNIKHHQFPFPSYAAALPWLAKRGSPFLGFGPAPHPDGSLHPTVGPQPGDNKLYQSAFRPVYPVLPRPLENEQQPDYELETCSDEETVDIETTEEEPRATTESSSNCWRKDQVNVSVCYFGHVNSFNQSFIHSLCSVSYDKFIAPSKTSSAERAI